MKAKAPMRDDEMPGNPLGFDLQNLNAGLSYFTDREST